MDENKSDFIKTQIPWMMTTWHICICQFLICVSTLLPVCLCKMFWEKLINLTIRNGSNCRNKTLLILFQNSWASDSNVVPVSLRFPGWLIPIEFVLNWLLNWGALTHFLTQNYIDSPDLCVCLLQMTLCQTKWGSWEINVMVLVHRSIDRLLGLHSMCICVIKMGDMDQKLNNRKS